MNLALTPDKESRSLVLLSQAREAIALARAERDIDALMEWRDRAAAYARYLSARTEAQEGANDLDEIKVRAERAIGQIDAESSPHGGDRMQEQDSPTEAWSPPPVASATRANWRKLGEVEDEAFEDLIDHAREDENVGVTTSNLVHLAKNPMAVHFTSASPEWYTPAEVIERVVQTLGAIDLDPCADANHGIPATTHYTEQDDGLSKVWRGRVYMNPPYGGAIKTWMQKLAAEFAAGHVTEAIALVPSRTDTVWFRRLPSQYVCFVRGRLEFSAVGVGAPFPSVLFYLGDRPSAFLSAFSDFGMLFRHITADELAAVT